MPIGKPTMSSMRYCGDARHKLSRLDWPIQVVKYPKPNELEVYARCYGSSVSLSSTRGARFRFGLWDQLWITEHLESIAEATKKPTRKQFNAVLVRTLNGMCL